MGQRLFDNLSGMQHDYMAPFLWLHNEDDSLILRELQCIYDSGIRSVCLESRTHEGFCTESWWSDVRLIMDFCREKGMHVWILDDKNFPSGKANGSFFKEEYKSLRPWGITERHMDVAGPVTGGSAMADCWKFAPEDEILGVLACAHVPGAENYTRVLDISEGLEDGMVYFTLPEGMWRIVFLIKTRSGLGEHDLHYCDMLCAESVKVFVDQVYEPHYANLKEYFGNTFLGFFSDEPSFRNNTRGNQFPKLGVYHTHYPWHDKLMEMLRKRLGCDPRKALAGLWFDIAGISDVIRHAYMDLISREYSANFCGQLAQWCHDHGIRYIGHIIEDNNSHAGTGIGPGHYFRALWDQDMSGIDVVLHQILPGLTECANAGYVFYDHMDNVFFHYGLAKLASSLAHQDPRKKGRAMCEIFGAYGWAEGTRTMKYLADHMLVRGINYYVPHAFSPKPNDMDCPPNFYDSGENALYKYFRCIMDYMNRACYLQSDGIHIPAAAILYTAEAHWVNKDFLPMEDCGKALYDNLLDYDYLCADILEELGDDGCISGERYPCLIVPYYEGIPAEITAKLERVRIPTILAVKPGMTVMEKSLREKYPVVELPQLASYVRREIGADVAADYAGIHLRCNHYLRGGMHSYLFTNEDIHNTIRTKVRLSAFSGGSFVLYDAMENTAVSCLSEDGTIPLELPPYNSVFVLFGDMNTEGIPQGDFAGFREQEISPVFEISLAEEKNGVFTHYKTTAQLPDITGRGERPRFSGNIRYEGEFDSSACQGCLLDLGYVGEAAEVFVNDISAGVRVIPPYVYDITEQLQPGKNSLRIVVSNHSGWRERDDFSKYMLFEPSGLLGPIKLKELN